MNHLTCFIIEALQNRETRERPWKRQIEANGRRGATLYVFTVSVFPHASDPACKNSVKICESNIPRCEDRKVFSFLLKPIDVVDNISTVMKSVSEGELGVEEVKPSTDLKNRDTASRLKRTFTLPRSMFQSATRISKRRSRQPRDSKENGLKENVRNNMQVEQRTQNMQQINGIPRSHINYICPEKNDTKKVFRTPSIIKANKIFKAFQRMGKQKKSLHRNELSSSASDLRVPLTRPPHVPSDRVPGVTGLRNHGNTCFMNAVLQCLSHTDILAEYFVLDRYKNDLSKRNKFNSKKYGTKGEITEQLALLLKAIWSCQYDPEMSTAFKSVVDKYGSQYRGNLQHDAQEFLLWLLDKVHEDLNTATKKYKSIKVSGCFPFLLFIHQ